MKLTPVLILAAMATFSCGPSKKAAESTPAADGTVAPVTDVIPASRGEVMKKPDVDVEKVEFYMNFLKTALEGSPAGNTVLSPYSAGMAFSMLTDGAKGKTRESLVQALSRSAFYGDNLYSDSLNIVKSANSIWLNRGFKAKDGYIGNLTNGYCAQVYSADAGDPFTAEAVNSWCGKHTEGLISHILDEIPVDTRMMLLNALYFKAPWLIPFSKDDTFKETFHGEAGDAEVDFMHKSSRSYGYALLPGCKVVNLPYKNNRYAMLVAIPDDMDKVVSHLDVIEFQNALSRLRRGDEVVLSLPRFKVEYTGVLNGIMEKLGAGDALTPGADFSGITDESVFVTSALQKCVLEVNEEGSEAAVVTAILVGRTSVAVQRPPVVIKVDRPFLFAIYDTKTQNILFEGKIADI
ncbi:MAG: serpin family protein [Bacteroidales bacterium]|nr:serpin family protein [Bacteroidales bacterium]